MHKPTAVSSDTEPTLLSSLEDLTEQVREAMNGGPTGRIEVTCPHETLGMLVEHLNHLIASSRRAMGEAHQSQERLAAALSHELNNPLGVIKSTSETLSTLTVKLGDNGSRPEKTPPIVTLIEELIGGINEAAKRMEQTIARMQRVTNLDRALVQTIDLNELLSDVVAMSGPRLEGKCDLKLNLEPLQPIAVRPDQLHTVFSALLDNAIHGSPLGGAFEISSLYQADRIEIRVKDNGEGLSAEQLRSIFEPGFEQVDEEGGLGPCSLFSSRQLIHEHGGEISLSSLKGKGTEVTVTLPVERKTAVE